MNTLIDAAIDRWRTVNLLLLFILVAGYSTYTTIPKEAAPDIQIPIIYVSMYLEGVSPEDAERLMIRPVEKKLSSVEGGKEMRATAGEGFASVTLEFAAGFNADKALEDVRAKVDEARPELPEEMDEPSVNEVTFSQFPILNVILTGEVNERTLITVARDLRDKIEGISTVLEAKISGDREEVLEIIIDPLTLEGYGLSVEEVFRMVGNNNVIVPAGEVDTGRGRYSIKLPGLVENIIDLMEIPIKKSGEAVITLKDVAEIRRTFKDPQGFAEINDQPAVGIGVSKRVGANIIDTVAEVRALVAEEQTYWPSGLEVIFSQDNSSRIRSMLSDLQNNVIFAVLLVVTVIIAVMGGRSAGLVGLVIPGAFLFGVLVIGSFGVTLNIVVLFSLILSIGMLVDAGIVVTEYADRLMMDGQKAKEAYGNAAKRMAWPIISSTVTTLVVFMPLLVWPGMVGEFMRYMPLTLIFTLMGSLLMALIFVPTLGTKLGKAAKVDDAHKEMILAAEKGEIDKLSSFTRGYVGILRWVLRHPWLFAMGIVAVIIAIMVSFGMFGRGVEFFPSTEPDNANVQVRARGNLSVLEQRELVNQVAERVKRFDDEIRVMYVRSGETGLRDLPEDTVGVIQLEYQDWKVRRTSEDILQEIREVSRDIPGIVIETSEQEGGPKSGKPVQIEFSSRFTDLTPGEVKQFLSAMDQIGGFMNIETDLPVPEIEWEFDVNRELAGRYGLDIRTIGNFVKLVTFGLKADTYRPDDADDEIDVMVRFPEEQRTLTQLERLRVNVANGTSVPVNNFITRTPKQKTGTLQRVDGKRVINVKADVAPGVLPDRKVKEVQAYFVENPPDPKVQVRFKGEDEDQKEAGTFLMKAFMIALFVMFVILVTQFNSIFHAFVILSAVFLSTGGVFVGLLINNEPFGIVMSGVGVISLAGIVVNNNIIFIDTFHRLKEAGIEAHEALIRTGAQRLRPILLTAGTTVLGLVPMVMQMTIDFLGREVYFGAPSSQWWVQLSTAIAGGLAFATVLTLLFTPALLMIGERFGKKT
jgi:multidrug efflux pump